MRHSLRAAALACAAFFSGGAAYAETATLNNPDWLEIPGTKPPGAGGEFGPAYVDIRGMIRRGHIRIYDMIGEGSEYARHELDCNKKQLRQLRLGGFLSKTRVRFEKMNHGWEPAGGPATEFICRQ